MPVVLIGVPCALFTWYGFDRSIDLLYVVAGFCLIVYAGSAFLGLFGGADAKALILMGLFVPAAPWEPVIGWPVFWFFPIGALANMFPFLLVTAVICRVYGKTDEHRKWLPFMIPITCGFVLTLLVGDVVLQGVMGLVS